MMGLVVCVLLVSLCR
jgi:hypothetical protein